CMALPACGSSMRRSSRRSPRATSMRPPSWSARRAPSCCWRIRRRWHGPSPAPRERGFIAERSDPRHAEGLDLEEVIHAVLSAFATDAGFLDAAEGRHLGGDDAGVDADDAVLDRLGDPPDAADVAAEEIGGEAELGVVGHADGLLLRLEAEERRHRP